MTQCEFHADLGRNAIFHIIVKANSIIALYILGFFTYLQKEGLHNVQFIYALMLFLLICLFTAIQVYFLFWNLHKKFDDNISL